MTRAPDFRLKPDATVRTGAATTPAGPALGMRTAFLIYDAGVSLVAWLALAPIELLQAVRRRARTDDLAERLGVAARWPRNARLRIVVHAVSVGETVAASAFIEQLAADAGDVSVVLTSGTREGRAIGERIRARVHQIERCLLLPWDRAGAVRRWLRALDPDAVVVVETEIWPNLYRACGDLGIPLFLVNARIYPRDVPRYALARGFFGEVLGAARWIGAISSEERNAFIRIGAPPERIAVVGNLKFDAPAIAAAAPIEQRARLEGSGGLIVGGTTHDPEERWLLDALRNLRPRFPALRLVLAPRRVERASRLVRLAERRGLRTVRWSEAAGGTDWDVLIVDRLGWLAALYEFADVVVLGGTLAPRGGHSVLEAIARGRAVIAGPHVDHVRPVIEALHRIDGAVWIQGRLDLSDCLRTCLRDLLENRERRHGMGQRARAFHESQRGAAERCSRNVLAQLAAPSGRPMPVDAVTRAECEGGA